MNRFTTRPYRPDGGITIGGLAALLAALAISGTALGFVASLVAKLFYLIVVFPLLIGLALGAVGTVLVKRGKLRNPWFGAAAGFLGGCLAMFVMHYSDYRDYRSDIAQVQPEIDRLKKMTPYERNQRLASLDKQARAERLQLVDKGPAKGLFEYLDLTAKRGVTLKKASRSGINLGYAGSYIYWIIEVLIVAGATLFIVYRAATEPFCASCEQWKQPRVLGTLNAPPDQVKAAIEGGDMRELAGLSPAAAGGPLRVTAACCPACGSESDIDVKLEQVTKDAKGNDQKKTLAFVTYTGKALPSLESLFSNPG